MSTSIPAVRTAIAGLGRSGWGIHARLLAEQPERFTRGRGPGSPGRAARRGRATLRLPLLCRVRRPARRRRGRAGRDRGAEPPACAIRDRRPAGRPPRGRREADGHLTGGGAAHGRGQGRHRPAALRLPELALPSRAAEGARDRGLGRARPGRAGAALQSRLRQTLGLADPAALRRRIAQQHRRPPDRCRPDAVRPQASRGCCT